MRGKFAYLRVDLPSEFWKLLGGHEHPTLELRKHLDAAGWIYGILRYLIPRSRAVEHFANRGDKSVRRIRVLLADCTVDFCDVPGCDTDSQPRAKLRQQAIHLALIFFPGTLLDPRVKRQIKLGKLLHRHRASQSIIRRLRIVAVR